jgi:RNA polymerase sigma factor (TIGR02999 family)
MTDVSAEEVLSGLWSFTLAFALILGMLFVMANVTQILGQIQRGDPAAAERLLPMVYDELKGLATVKMFAERPDHTLQATALVHEAYVRLVDAQRVQRWDSRGHFFSAAAEAMRRILVESARRRNSRKRGGNCRRVGVEDLDFAATMDRDPDLLLDIDAGLARLAEEDPEVAQLVKLRLFAGLSVSEAGEMLGMSRSAAYRNWDYIRSWFAVHFGE